VRSKFERGRDIVFGVFAVIFAFVGYAWNIVERQRTLGPGGEHVLVVHFNRFDSIQMRILAGSIIILGRPLFLCDTDLPAWLPSSDHCGQFKRWTWIGGRCWKLPRPV